MSGKRGQRGSVVKKGTSYFMKYRGPDGKQVMKGSSPGHGFKTEEEAVARLHETLTDISKGTFIEQKNISFSDFVEQWLASRVSIRGSTESAYGSIIRKHLVPRLGTLRLHEINLETVQSLVVELRPALSAKSLHNCLTLLHVILAGKKGPSAIKVGHLRYDPTEGVELPAKATRKIQPPTQTQVWKLIDTAEEAINANSTCWAAYAAIFLDAFSGLRRGEILALRYADIQWFEGEIVVSQAVSKVKSNDGVHKWLWQLGPTKNGKTRRVGVGKQVIAFLSNLKQGATDPQGFLFPSEMVGRKDSSYEFIDPDYFDRSVYGPVAAAAGLQKVRFHDLRHFFASMLIAQGENPKYVCDQMGHSSIQVTFDTYGHLFPQARQEASARLEEAMFSQRKQARVENVVENGSSATLDRSYQRKSQ